MKELNKKESKKLISLLDRAVYNEQVEVGWHEYFGENLNEIGESATIMTKNTEILEIDNRISITIEKKDFDSLDEKNT